MPRYHGKLAADFIAFVHALWVFAALAALPLVVVDPDLKAAAMGFILLMTGMWLLWRDCPLRVWELRLREKFDPQHRYDGAFISHYLHRFTGLRISTHRIRLMNWTYSALLVVVIILV